LGVPRKGLKHSHGGALPSSTAAALPSLPPSAAGRDVARATMAEMRTKQKTPFAAILSLKYFL